MALPIGARVAWRGVAWRGVAWRGVAWRGGAGRGVRVRVRDRQAERGFKRQQQRHTAPNLYTTNSSLNPFSAAAEIE